MNIIEDFRDVVGKDPTCKYREKKAIGSGSFAVVWQLIENSTNKSYVGKFMDLSKMSDRNKRFALGEADNVSKCNHPNIIEYIEKFQKGNKLLLIFAFADGGDLGSQIQHRLSCGKAFKDSEIIIIFTQLCLAINYLHSMKMMHRDLKTPNVLLTTSGLIKLSDFGFSRQYDDSLSSEVGSTFCGTPYYLAPELWNQDPYSAKADVWSLGVIFYELLTLKKPFLGNTMKDLVNRVVQGSIAPMPSTVTPALAALCTRMLSVDAAARPTVRDILCTEVIRTGGLKVLQGMVPRLTTIPEEVRAAFFIGG